MIKRLLILGFILSGIIALALFLTSRPAQHFQEVSFSDLSQWSGGTLKSSMSAFQSSCRVFLKKSPNSSVGTTLVELKAGDWQEVCKKALSFKEGTEDALHHFFEEHFRVFRLLDNRKSEGLFTGYYSPLLEGSLEKSKTFNVPLYQQPSDLISVDLRDFSDSLPKRSIVGRVDEKKRLRPYYTRASINNGALEKKSKVLVWLKDPIDRTFLEIQGSGIVSLLDGQLMYVGYAAENGRKYRSIAKVLIDKGVMNHDNASMQGIKKYLSNHPKERQEVLNQNESFVFFRQLKEPGAIGAQGVALTDEVSLAVDRQYIPLGAPLWLETSYPNESLSSADKPLRRLMIAQDTGGAIKGVIRGDVYWGATKQAASIAGRMKNKGSYFILLPKSVKVS